MNFGPDQVARDGLNRLCNALLQNDPEVTKVTTRSAIIDFSMDSMGAIMGRIPEEVRYRSSSSRCDDQPTAAIAALFTALPFIGGHLPV
jgi:hypothetical protein